MNKKTFYTFKYMALLSLFIFSLNASAVDSDHFVTKWTTTTTGGIHSITIPTNSKETYNYSIDWNNNGTFDDFNVTGDATHNYVLPGIKTIRIVGAFPRIFINNDTHRLNIISIEQWGTNPWTSMQNAFYGAENLVNNADDTPNFGSANTLLSMFGGATNIGTGTGNWDWNTTGVTNMAYMFESTNFNKNIGSWDTSSVTNFSRMFLGATSFDQDLSSWDVEAATHLFEMFSGITLSSLNYEALLISWANQNINNSLTFDGGASQYCSQAARTARNSLILSDGLTITDGGLCEGGYFITTWKTDNPGTSNSTSITIPTESSEIYSYQVDWNGDGDFNDSDENINYSGNATHNYGSIGTYTVKIKGIFPQIYFNNERDKEKILSIEQWGTKAWGSMLRAYQGTSNLSMNATDTPDLSSATQMGAMFDNTGNLGVSTGDWSWDTSNVTDMTGLFSTSTFDFDISNWNVEADNAFGSMFAGSTLSTLNYDALLIAWDSQALNSGRTFSGGTSQYCSQEAQDAKASIIANDSWTITDGGLDPSCDTSIDTNHFVITLDTTIAGSTGSNSFEIPTTGTGYNYKIDTNNNGTFNITDVTGNTTINYGAGGVKTIRIAGDFPRIFFNESGDKDKILSVEQWGATHWKSMNNAFSGASNLVINATDTPDLSNVSSLFKMFLGAIKLGNGTGVWNWDTSNITGMSQTFKDAIAFDEDISSWNVENVGNFGAMFSGATLSEGNYDALLISWDAQNLRTGQLFNGGNSKYCTQAAVDAHANIIAIDGWTINDGGYNSTCDGIDIMENHFVITVNTENAGSSGSDSFTIPINDGIYSYSYHIDGNNDGVFEATARTDSRVLTYLTPGIKTIRIYGDFPTLYFNESGDKDKILSIEQWGNNNWVSMNSSFAGASNLVINATDTPDLSNTTSLFKMFSGTANIGNGTGNWNWDTSNITSMAQTFQNATSFDNDLSFWDIGSVSNLGAMFDGVTLSNANYDALLISWEAQTPASGLVFSGGNSQYCSQAAQDAHLSLTTGFNWGITDAGFNPACAPNQAPLILSSNTIDMDENTTNVVIVNAVDPESDDITFTITGGVDSSLFSIGSVNGFLRFINAPDYETPISAANNNFYQVQITATDNGVPIASESQTILISVLDVVENTPIDLSLVIISSPSSAMAGALAEYQIQITNVGSQDAIDSNVTDILPAELIASSWVCSSTGSASCSASGVGEINDVISVPVGTDSVTYTVSTTVISDSFSQILYQAQVLATAPEFDEDLSNNMDEVTIINGDIVFANSFESPLVKFATANKSLQINFSKLSKIKGVQPFAQGVDDYGFVDMWIHIRKNNEQLQIRMSNKENGIWFIGQWQDVKNTELTTLFWN